MKARACMRIVILLVAATAAVPAAAHADGDQGRLHRPVMRATTTFSMSAPSLPDPIGPFSLSGTVLDYGGAPVEGADVQWGWYDPNAPVWFGSDVQYHYGGSTDTGTGGVFSFSGVTSSPGNDELTAFYPDYVLTTWTNDFSTQSSYTVRPGLVPVTVSNPPSRRSVDVSIGDAATGVALTWGGLTGGSGLAAACAPGFDTAEASVLDAIGAVTAATEWTSPGHAVVPVTPGVTVSEPIVFDWLQAKRGYLAGPRCRHSLRPGETATFVLRNWPAGYRASFWGQSWAEEGAHWYATTTLSDGADNTYRVRLRVPGDASLRDVYQIGAYRSDDPKSELYVYDLLQLCRFAATRDAIARGQSIQLRGFARGPGNVVLFKRAKAAKQPGTLAAKRWTRVGVLERSNGRFASGWLHPSRTTWYTVRYRGPAFSAFTPVVKVTVR